MGEFIRAFKTGFIDGVKETPRMYFAPVSAMLRTVYEQAVGDDKEVKKTDSEKNAA